MESDANEEDYFEDDSEESVEDGPSNLNFNKTNQQNQNQAIVNVHISAGDLMKNIRNAAVRDASINPHLSSSFVDHEKIAKTKQNAYETFLQEGVKTGLASILVENEIYSFDELFSYDYEDCETMMAEFEMKIVARVQFKKFVLSRHPGHPSNSNSAKQTTLEDSEVKTKPKRRRQSDQTSQEIVMPKSLMEELQDCVEEDSSESLRYVKEVKTLQNEKMTSNAQVRETPEQVEELDKSFNVENVYAADEGLDRQEIKLIHSDSHKRRVPRKKRANSWGDSRADPNPRQARPKAQKRDVPLVEFEYRSMTAAAVFMKYNKKGPPYNKMHITSQELIQSSQNLPFYNFYDFMCDYVESRRRAFEARAHDRDDSGPGFSLKRREAKQTIENYLERNLNPRNELEYLNLTATAVFMKYKRKGPPYNKMHITAQELIQVSQNLPFYNIYDFMWNYVESRRRNFETRAHDFTIGQEVVALVWKESMGEQGDTIVGEIIDVFEEDGTGTLSLSVSDGRTKYEVKACDVSKCSGKQRRRK